MATCRDCIHYSRTNTYWCKYYRADIARDLLDQENAEKECVGYNWRTEVKGED